MGADATTAVWNDVPRAMLERFFVGGEWREPSSKAENRLISQVSEEAVLTHPDGAERDVDAAVAAARRAFDAGPWPRLGFAERGSYLKTIAAALRERADLSARLHTAQVLGYIRLGRESGARLVTGGGRAERFARGYFVEPTVFADVDPASAIAQEEIFGPVVSVITYKDEDDAIRIANGTKYGLNGAVFTADEGRGIALARRMRAGSVNVNTFNIRPRRRPGA